MKTHDSNEQYLNALWQTQTQHQVDLALVEKKAKAQRRKQRLYIALDIASLLPFTYFFFISDKLNSILLGFVFFAFISGLAMVVYFVKLRWQIAYGPISDTDNYIKQLCQQYKNNRLIAQINIHMGWISVLFAMLAVYLVHIFDNIAWADKSLRIIVVSCSLLAFTGFWCSLGLQAETKVRKADQGTREAHGTYLSLRS